MPKVDIAGEYLPADENPVNYLPASVPDDDPDDVALANVIAELGTESGDAVVNVYQIDDKKNRAFVGSFSPSDFSIGLIQSQFGAGEYRVEVRQNKRWLKKSTIRIASQKTPPIGSVAPPPTIDAAKIIETMQSGFSQLGQMFAGAIGQLAQNQPKPKSTMEMLQEMQLMKEIMWAGTQVQSGPDPMQLFEMATNIAEKITPRQGEPGAGELILEAMKNFGPVLQKAANTPAPTFSPVPAVPAPPPVTAPVTVPQDEEMFVQNMARKMFINMLVGNARNDPEFERVPTYANMLIDTVGEDSARQLVELPDWFERLSAENSGAMPYKAWFEKLRAAVIEVLTDDDSGDIKAEITRPD